MITQKSKFWTFVFSLVPGCGHMYMGFMRRGVSLLSAFALVTFLGGFSGISILNVIAAVIWFFAFFDSLNLMSMPFDLFAKQRDEYYFVGSGPNFAAGSSLMRPVGIALIVIGAFSVFKVVFSYFANSLSEISSQLYGVIWSIVDMLPEVIVCALIIYIGVRMVVGKKKELNDAEHKPE